MALEIASVDNSRYKVEIYAYLAWLNALKHDFNQAKLELNKADELDPEHELYLFLYIMIDYLQGNTKNVKSCYLPKTMISKPWKYFFCCFAIPKRVNDSKRMLLKELPKRLFETERHVSTLSK
ncbi:MAG: hypothetical protein IV090_03025 [Candidatus Sericytochromatia bacterium]|nr:hypothetical protein [Candidatus Sericytochromatia bacterium]